MAFASTIYMLSEMPDMIRPLSQEDVHGDIDGEAHTAASTYGDGTCALHALFGLPVKGQLYAHGVRDVFANTFNHGVSSVFGQQSSAL